MSAVLLFLLSFLLRLHYDGSRLLGDVACSLLNRWQESAVHNETRQRVKLVTLERLKGNGQAPAGVDDEIAEAEGLREKFGAIANWLSGAETELNAWGYSRFVPAAPPRPAPPGPPLPERK